MPWWHHVMMGGPRGLDQPGESWAAAAAAAAVVVLWNFAHALAVASYVVCEHFWSTRTRQQLISVNGYLNVLAREVDAASVAGDV